MRVTLTIDDELLKRAGELSGVRDRTALVRAGLEALIARATGKRVAALFGTDPKLTMPRRRQSVAE
jgi:hypothetical protein